MDNIVVDILLIQGRSYFHYKQWDVPAFSTTYLRS